MYIQIFVNASLNAAQLQMITIIVCDYHIENYKEFITKEGTVNLEYPGVSSHKCMFRLDGGDE